MKIKASRASPKAGFTLVEIMIVLAIIGLLAAIAIPNYVTARTMSQKNACINNLRQLDGAIQQYALENKQSPSAPVTLNDATPYLKSQIICSAGGTTSADSYAVTDVGTQPTCIAPGGKAAAGHVLTGP